MFGAVRKLLAGILAIEKERADRLEANLMTSVATLNQVRETYRADMRETIAFLAQQNQQVAAAMSAASTESSRASLVAMAEVTRAARSCCAAVLAGRTDAAPETAHAATVLGMQEAMREDPPAPQTTPDELDEEVLPPPGSPEDVEVDLLGGPPTGAGPTMPLPETEEP